MTAMPPVRRFGILLENKFRQKLIWAPKLSYESRMFVHLMEAPVIMKSVLRMYLVLPRTFHFQAAQSCPIAVPIEEVATIIATVIDTGRME
jgi:hypothetical protein